MTITSRTNAAGTASVDVASGRFSGFADVTTLVQQGGSGAYTVADIQAGRGSDRYGGWALVLAIGKTRRNHIGTWWCSTAMRA